jgi:hypothetical protein
MHVHETSNKGAYITDDNMSVQVQHYEYNGAPTEGIVKDAAFYIKRTHTHTNLMRQSAHCFTRP